MPITTIHQGDCMHNQWCNAKPGEPHAAECPFVVLKLSDGDVEAFFAEHGRADERGIRASYDGRSASSSESDLESRRWLAENLLIHAKLGTVRR